MSETIILDRDYGYSDYDLSWGVDGGTIDATAATWIVANSRNENPVEGRGADTGDLPINRYPVQIRDADGLTFLGGNINGEVPLGSDWTYTYRDDYPDGESANSAALRIDDSRDATIEGWRISRPWDAIRITGDSDDFTISDVWVSQSRDDAIENDDVLSGTIRDSLFENVFSGISLGDSNAPDGSDNVVTLDNVLLKSGSYLYKGEVTHVSPIKMDKDDDITPNLRILNTVFAIEDVDHGGQERLQKAWNKTIESKNNVFLNLSDDPLPDDYPRPGKGWTILQGEDARDYWDTVSSEFKESFGDDSDSDTPTDPGEPPEPEPSNTDPVAEDDEFEGSVGAALTGRLSATDVDGDGLTFALIDGPRSGSVVINSDGRFRYDADGDFDSLGVGQTATAEFSYSVSDGRGGSDSGTVQITIAGEYQPDTSPADINIILGTDGSDRLEGTEGADIFRTGDGARDTIYGLDGADTLVFGAEARDGNQTMERFKDFNPSEDTIVLEYGATMEWIRERDDRLAIKIEGDGDRLYLYGDDLSADDVNFISVESAYVPPTASGEPSATLILGTDGSDRLEGTEGADIFRTGDGARDTIYGLDGADTLVFGAEARDGNQTMERFKDFNPSEDTIVLEYGATMEWIRERDDRLAIKIEGDGDRLYLYGDDLSAEDVNFVFAWGDWVA